MQGKVSLNLTDVSRKVWRGSPLYNHHVLLARRTYDLLNCTQYYVLVFWRVNADIPGKLLDFQRG
jgi:hypothetical protein